MATEAHLADNAAPGLRHSLAVQYRVIGALLMREIVTRHGRHNIGFMWIFVEPMMFTLGVVTLWSLFHMVGHRLPLVPFLVTGYGTVLMWRNTTNRAGEACRRNKPLLFHRNVRFFDILIASSILEAAGATISFVVLSAFFMFVGMIQTPYDISEMFAAWLLLTWFCVALSLLIGALGVFSEMYIRIWHIVGYLMLPVCGAFTMMDWLPESVRTVLLWNPMVTCVELLRAGLWGPSIHTHYRIFYTICANLGFLLVALRMVVLAAREFEDGVV
jgi:capsular polysaccharide transport system permease protein